MYPLFIICAVGFIIYSNSFECSFHLDDYSNIINNSAVRSIVNFHAISDFAISRFVGVYTLALNYHFHQLDVFGYHLVNMIIHIGSSLIVWWLVTLILSTPAAKGTGIAEHKKLVAFGCSLLFLAHPIQTQAVTYIVQRYASMATLFYLFSVSLYVKARLVKSKTRFLFFAASGCTAILGFFTKEIVFTLPFSLILVEVYFFSGGIKKLTILRSRWFWLSVIAFIVFSGLFLMVSPFHVSRVFSAKTSPLYSDPPITSALYMMTQFRVIITYIRLLFIPTGLRLDYDFPVSQSFYETPTVLSFLFILFLIGTAVMLFSRQRLVSFGIVWFFVTLSVESGIIPLEDVIFEHRLYLPMFGFSVFFVSAFYTLFFTKRQKASILVFLILIGVLSFLTYKRNTIWKDEFTLCNDTIKKSPNHPRAYVNLGQAYKGQGNLKKAKESYSKALEIHPEYPAAHNNLSSSLIEEGKFAEAEEHVKFAIQKDPRNPLYRANLGIVLLEEGNIEEAKKQLNKALEINPYVVKAYFYLGKAFRKEGNTAEAFRFYTKALDLNPDYPDAYYELGCVYFTAKKLTEAKKMFVRTLEISPENIDAYNYLGNVYAAEGNFTEAKNQFHKAIALKPENSETYNNLGIVFAAEGNLPEAKKNYDTAIRLNPDNARAYYNLGNALYSEGNTGEAKKQYERAVHIDSTFVEAYNNWGGILFVEGNYEEAKRQYIRILHIDPDLPETLYNLGRVYEMEGNFPEAEKQYREALRIDPNDSDAKASLEKVLSKLKRKQPGK